MTKRNRGSLLLQLKKEIVFFDKGQNSDHKRKFSNKTGIQDKCLLFFVPRDKEKIFSPKGISLKDFMHM